MKRIWLLWIILALAACSDEEERRVVDTALDAEQVYERAHAKYLRDWNAVAIAFTVRGGTLARDNYLDGKESETPAQILAAGTYRRAVESTDAYLEALDAYDAALQAVEDAGAWDLLEEVASEPAPEPVTPIPAPDTRHRLVQKHGCQWIADNYRTMAAAGRDTAIQHVANVMNIQSGQNVFSYVSAGDAAAAIRECEDTGYR